MNVTHEFEAELLTRGLQERICAMQNDANTRSVKLTLLSGGTAWPVPAGTKASVVFRNLKDGHKGWYDTLPNGTAACTVSGNVVTAVLAPAVLSGAGEVKAAIVFQDGNLNRLATLGFSILVEPDPAAGTAIANDYYKYSTMEAVSEAVDAMLESLEETKADIGQLISQINTAVAQVQQEAGPAIVPTASGIAIAVQDSAGRQLQGLTLYGKTTQEDEPYFYDSPVALESVGDGGSITVKIAGKNLLNNQATTATINGITFTVNADKSVTVNGTATAQTALKLHAGNFLTATDFAGYILSGCPSGMDKNKYCILVSYHNSNGNWQAEAYDTGSGLALSGNYPLVQISILVRSGVTVPNVTFYPMVRDASFIDATYEPYKEIKTLSLTTPNGLHGIPVTSGGNYTDAEGQAWVCDEIDLARGVYVQRIGVADFSQGTWVCQPEKKGSSYLLPFWIGKNPQYAAAVADVTAMCYCTHFPWSNRPLYSNDVDNVVVAWSNCLMFRCDEFATEDGADFVNWLKTEGVKVMYQLATPVETALDADTLTAYAALHSNKPNTSVLNDAGAGMGLRYVADTKTYIDNKFTELQSAIIAAGANV